MSDRPPGELDQEYEELLSELRVVLPGIQLLAAFLLILPFNAGFREATADAKGVYFVAFVSAVFASILTIAPTSQHRIRWREGDKEALLLTANRLTIAGTISLAVSLAASVFLVAQVLYEKTAASLVTGAMVASMAWWWYVQPLIRRARDGKEREPRPE